MFSKYWGILQHDDCGKMELGMDDCLEKIVITGIGAITPLGGDLETIKTKLKSGQSGIDFFHSDEMSESQVRHAGIVRDEYFSADQGKWVDVQHRPTKLALYATEMALKQADLGKYYDSSRMGMYIGTEPPTVDFSKQAMQLNDFLQSDLTLNTSQGDSVNGGSVDLIESGLFPQLMLSTISYAFSINGPAFLHLGTCSASAQSIGEAANMLRRGEVDLMIAGGASSKLDPISIARLMRVGALALTTASPSELSRPFDSKRCGFTMAEGSVMFVLERLSDALARGVKPIAEVAGYGAALDGYSITDPHPESLGMTLSMMRALQDANLDPGDIDYLNAHGTSTVKNDFYETNAIKNIFGDLAYSLDISSTKSMHGHLMSAAGAMEALVSILSIKNNFIPPTINYQDPDAGCDLSYTTNKYKEKNISAVLSNSFGLGGQNCSLVIKKVI